MIAHCQNPARLIAAVEISRVEMAAAFAGKLRGNFITPAEYQQARAALAADSRNRYHLLPITADRVDEAIELTTRHKLRGYDAIHLACALHLNKSLQAQQLAPLTFVTADLDLLTAAQAEGLATANPNDTP